MYAAIWRLLPGPWWVRLFIVLVLLGAIVYGLYFYAFPWVSHMINPQQSTIGGG